MRTRAHRSRWPEWVYAGKAKQSVRIFGNLRASPIIFRHHMRILVWNTWLIGVGKAIRNGEHDSSLDSGSIEIGDQITSTDALWSWGGSGAGFGAIQGLVIVDYFGEQAEWYEDAENRDHLEASY
jgi:hypothetical protein